MDVIETADVELAAYALARGGRLRGVLAKADTVRSVFRIEGLRLSEAEIDFAHFGPADVEPKDYEWHRLWLLTLWGARS